jgi:hypothetical protein
MAAFWLACWMVVVAPLWVMVAVPAETWPPVGAAPTLAVINPNPQSRAAWLNLSWVRGLTDAALREVPDALRDDVPLGWPFAVSHTACQQALVWFQTMR